MSIPFKQKKIAFYDNYKCQKHPEQNYGINPLKCPLPLVDLVLIIFFSVFYWFLQLEFGFGGGGGGLDSPLVFFLKLLQNGCDYQK